MTEEPTSGTVVGDTGVRGLDARTSEPTWEHEEYHGRPVSWVAVTIIIIGFIIVGIAETVFIEKIICKIIFTPHCGLIQIFISIVSDISCLIPKPVFCTLVGS